MKLHYQVDRGVSRIKNKFKQFSGRTAIMSALTVSALGLALIPLASAATEVIVTPTNTQGWSTADTRPGGTVTYVSDATSPYPTGALQLTTDSTNEAKAQYLHAATGSLNDVTELSYYTKQVSGPAVADPSYQLGIDVNGAATGGFTNLVYEPYWNGTVTPGVWENWDVDAGQLWSSGTVSDGQNCNLTSGAGGPPFYTLAALKIACPSAVVVSIGVNVGTYNPNYVVETDGVNFNGTVYNFELVGPTVKVTIDKYIDGSMATVLSANSSTFPMQATWSTTNIGSGSGDYGLGPVGYNTATPYQAVTSDMSQGSSYSTNEVTTGPVVSTTCTPSGAPYALVGYSTGETLAQAQAAGPSAASPAFTNIQNDKFVIVWNKTCPPAPAHPTNKDQCKDNGWKTLVDANNKPFKNQGDCVSYVATNGKNKANG